MLKCIFLLYALWCFFHNVWEIVSYKVTYRAFSGQLNRLFYRRIKKYKLQHIAQHCNMFDDKVVFQTCLHRPVGFRELRCFTTQVLS